MPEGDAIHRTAAALQKVLANQPVVRFQSFVAKIGGPQEEKISGSVVLKVEAVGKNLLIHFSSGFVLHSHMRMTGSWHIYRKGERWRKSPAAARIVIEVPNFVAVCFSAPIVRFMNHQSIEKDSELGRIGPDLLNDSTYDPDLLVSRLAKFPEMEIGVALLRQDLIAGIGNVYKSETLFLEKVNPFSAVSELGKPTLQRLVGRASDLMRQGLRNAEIRTRRSLDPAIRLWVYKRAGQACLVCGTSIEMRRQGRDRRSTYFCRKCQSVTKVITHLERYSGSF